ncbi:MAG: hypothetical protein ACOYIG_04950 [Acetivibrionales bacterium]|jgi:hypothetical protein|nr:hypothetical protein [Anaerohalosphaeraceae bacterium]HRT88384.1 hypothetical protein [Anaerohalosphaeraceae bacterium]
MVQRDAKREYEITRNDIANLMGFFECELDKEPKNILWGDVGDLKYVRHQLIEALAFMARLRTADVKRSLEELRPQEND